MTYDNFRNSVEVDFGDRNDIESKEYLNVLMRRRGYFNAKDSERRERQSIKLLDEAWNHLNNLGVVKRETYIITEEREVKRERYSITPRGFKKRQIRDRKTGRILGWE